MFFFLQGYNSYMTNLPVLDLATWQKTRDSLQIYAKLLGKIQQQLIPPQKHFWHYGLQGGQRGIQTQPAKLEGKTIQLTLDLTNHQLEVSNGTETQTIPLTGQSAASICKQTLAALSHWHIVANIDQSLFTDETPLAYDPDQARAFGQALSHIAELTEKFKVTLSGETSPVQLFPHHFDLSLTWFSGRKVPGQDPNDEEASDESMTFGFSTGDEGVPEAYLYVTAYPTPETWTSAALPDKASWHTEGWTGALLPYSALVQSTQTDQLVLNLFQAAWQAGEPLMTD